MIFIRLSYRDSQLEGLTALGLCVEVGLTALGLCVEVDLHGQFPDFSLVDKAVLQGEGVVSKQNLIVLLSQLFYILSQYIFQIFF